MALTPSCLSLRSFLWILAADQAGHAEILGLRDDFFVSEISVIILQPDSGNTLTAPDFLGLHGQPPFLVVSPLREGIIHWYDIWLSCCLFAGLLPPIMLSSPLGAGWCNCHLLREQSCSKNSTHLNDRLRFCAPIHVYHHAVS